MSTEQSVKRYHKAEMSSMLSEIQACTKEILNIKQDMNQKFEILENNTNFIPITYTALLKRMDALENAQKNKTNCSDHTHECCQKVLSKLNSMEDTLRKIPRSSRFWASKHNEHHNEANKIQMKLEAIEELLGKIMKNSEFFLPLEEKTENNDNKPVVLYSTQKPPHQVSACVSLDSSVQVITLNSESDFPNGSWLGDESNPECRVRCGVSPGEILHVNTICQSPEKMALTLLDYLFPREVLAVSNLSGKGKHGKKQLDPLLIYGIRCHLIHKFAITEQDWYRIKQNMDSKCRTAWRKKVRGLPLGGVRQQNRSISEPQNDLNRPGSYISGGTEGLIFTANPCYEEEEDGFDDFEAEVIHTNQGDFQVLHATPIQFARLREAHHVQVFSEQELLPVLEGNSQFLDADDSIADYKNALSMDCKEIHIDAENIDVENIDERKDVHLVNSEALGDLGTIEVITENMEFIPISQT